MALLNREKLLSRQELKIERVDLSDDDYVYVRQMTGRERDRFEASIVRPVRKGQRIEYEHDLADFRAKLAVCTVCDEHGNLILTQSDYERLSECMPAAMLERIVERAQAINRIGPTEVEDLSKNSCSALAGATSSGSA